MPSKPLSDLEALIGDSRRTVEEFRIEAGKVAEFARAITDPNPVFRDEAVARDRGYDRRPAPLPYSQVSRFPRYRVDDRERYGFDLGFRPEYVLHGEQAYEYDRPLLVGDVLTGTTTLVDVFQRDGEQAGTMTFAVFETAYRDRNGDRVLTERATAIETPGAIDDETHDGPAETAADGKRSGSTVDEPTASVRSEAGGAGDDGSDRRRGSGGAPGSVDRVHSVSDVAVGDAGPAVVVEDVERRDFVTYAGASGDFNPIHYDEPYARAAGNESVFGQGMFTAGVVSRVVTDWFGLEPVSSFGVRFRSRVFPGDTIVATGEVDAVSEDGTVETTLRATTKTGRTLLTGTAAATLPADG
ncbi:MaoC family dehydratase [Halopiger djelfimassiliensis]|uniref:MaoC family dehydratase n=1 Tax=Halopiger djelfimassiliensis TaxID=1293047 RepID=UPI00067818D9|nr:MaoC family dehydratase N-terminal domain-containing protein [Halopiger djelfimassiliensis]